MVRLSVGKGGQLLLNLLPAHVDPQPRLHKPLMVVLFDGQRVGLLGRFDRGHVRQIVLGPDRLPKSLADVLAKCFQVHKTDHAVLADDVAKALVDGGVFLGVDDAVDRHPFEGRSGRLAQLATGQSPVDPQPSVSARVVLQRRDLQVDLPDRLLEPVELLGRLVVLGHHVRPLGLRHVGDEGRIAEKEQGPGAHLRVAEHAVEDFQLRDALARLVLYPAVLGQSFLAECLGDPAVPLAENAYEERAALVDLLQTEIEHPVPLCFLLSDAPAEVDVDQMDTVLLQPFSQRREGHLDQVIAFRVHVAEGGGDEHTDGFPGDSHRNSRNSHTL